MSRHVPSFRSDIAALKPYKVGRQLADVARAHGLDPDEIVKLTANELSEGPFPGVVEATAAVLAGSNRYPDNDCWELGHALAAELGVDFANLVFGAGSVALLNELAVALGGPGTNLVFGWPSFVMYRFTAIWTGMAAKEVPLDADFRLDLEAMRGDPRVQAAPAEEVRGAHREVVRMDFENDAGHLLLAPLRNLLKLYFGYGLRALYRSIPVYRGGRVLGESGNGQPYSCSQYHTQMPWGSAVHGSSSLNG